ncbi:hypothetical protein FHX39_001400 [Friedmanniella antarctica]|uniref:Uncharacterized protein n=1 Tax=Microlunatus antarcticus TaxID=53388 RepID=A0A7W5JUS8_9ACTN|nr:hypothetical protein [Microlunatus antarcticus]
MARVALSATPMRSTTMPVPCRTGGLHGTDDGAVAGGAEDGDQICACREGDVGIELAGVRRLQVGEDDLVRVRCLSGGDRAQPLRLISGVPSSIMWTLSATLSARARASAVVRTSRRRALRERCPAPRCPSRRS